MQFRYLFKPIINLKSYQSKTSAVLLKSYMQGTFLYFYLGILFFLFFPFFFLTVPNDMACIRFISIT